MKKLLLAAAVVAMVGCEKSETSIEMSSGIEAAFQASQIVTRTSGNSWEDNDQVAIYMYQAGKTESSYSLARENVLYTADLSGDFTVAAGVTPIYYPQSDEVDFYAYYPYQAGIATTYAADITAQNLADGSFDQGAVDFMTASLEGQSKTTEAVGFEFDHRLAMLTIVVTHKASITSLTGAEVTLSEINTQATFSTLTGEMIASGSVAGSIELLTAETKTDSASNATEITATAIILPEELDAEARVTFTLSETQSFTAMFPDDATFIAGKNHTYYITLGTDVSSGGSTGGGSTGGGGSVEDEILYFEGSGTITPWGSTVIDGVIDADETK